MSQLYQVIMTAKELRIIENEQQEFNASLDLETDRGCCLMASSYLEYQLENILKKRLVDNESIHEKLFGFNGPLGTFSSKIEMAYAFGLIAPKAKQDLNLIRKIRNEFAHDHRLLTFADKPMCDFIDNFYYNTPGKKKGQHRHNFILTVVGVFSIIIGQRLSIEHIEENVDIVFDSLIISAIQKMQDLKAKGIITGLIAPETKDEL